jgi:hypothetical protein
VDGFLKAVGTSRDDPTTARMAVEIVLLSYEGSRMPKGLRAELIAAGVLEKDARVRPEANVR